MKTVLTIESPQSVSERVAGVRTARRGRWAALFGVVLLLCQGSAWAVDDPFEVINRPLFKLNDGIDRFALKPLARGYDFVTPTPVQRGVGNFFANLYDVTSTLNAVLQWRWDHALESGGRVVVNSTLGVLGIFDVATPLGVRPYRTDFGQTLAVWGVPDGPYIMVPLLGPRTFRTGAATMVDTLLLSVPPYVDNHVVRNTIWGVELVHARSTFLEADVLISGDRYIFVRDAYLQQRAALLNDGEVVDDFSSSYEDDWETEF